MVEVKDVMTAVAGVSAAVAGFALVFLGLLASSEFAMDARPLVFRLLSGASVTAFVLGVISTALAIVWMTLNVDKPHAARDTLYLASLTTFFLMSLVLILLAVVVSTALYTYVTEIVPNRSPSR